MVFHGNRILSVAQRAMTGVGAAADRGQIKRPDRPRRIVRYESSRPDMNTAETHYGAATPARILLTCPATADLVAHGNILMYARAGWVALDRALAMESSKGNTTCFH